MCVGSRERVGGKKKEEKKQLVNNVDRGTGVMGVMELWGYGVNRVRRVHQEVQCVGGDGDRRTTLPAWRRSNVPTSPLEERLEAASLAQLKVGSSPYHRSSFMTDRPHHAAWPPQHPRV